MRGMEPITLIVLALAVARITILITRDAILEPLRHRIFTLSPPPNNRKHGWHYQNLIRATPDEQNLNRQNGISRFDSRWQDTGEENRDPGFAGELLSCPDCTGIWVGIAWYLAWLEAPGIVETVSVPLALALAASWIARRGGYS